MWPVGTLKLIFYYVQLLKAAGLDYALLEPDSGAILAADLEEPEEVNKLPSLSIQPGD